MAQGFLGLVVTIAALAGTSASAATKQQFPLTCGNAGGYPQVRVYLNQGKKAGYDVFKTPEFVEATVTTLSDAKQILARLCVEKAALEGK